MCIDAVLELSRLILIGDGNWAKLQSNRTEPDPIIYYMSSLSLCVAYDDDEIAYFTVR